jgi:hypothetical protein
VTDINDIMAASCSYEHRDSKGRLVSKGLTKVDWLGKVHAIQKNYRTGEVTQTIWLPDGTLHKKVVRVPLRVKFLRLVGLKKK